jgi:hypothetical protein
MTSKLKRVMKVNIEGTAVVLVSRHSLVDE